MIHKTIRCHGGFGNKANKSLPTDSELDENSSKRINSNFVKYNIKQKTKDLKKFNGLYGYGVALPLSFSEEGPYNLNVYLADQLKQNFKNLMLTEQGERVMDIFFGVGLKSYLFEQNSLSVQQEIQNRVVEQTSKYMPFISLESIELETDDQDLNYLGVTIYYSIPSLSISDSINIQADNGGTHSHG